MWRKGFSGSACLRFVPPALMLLAAGLSAGCAYVTAVPRKPGERINGIPIYDVKPLLIVSGDNVTIEMVPNYNRPYALRFGAFLAKNNFDASLQNGIVTHVKADLDSTKFIEVLTALIGKLPDAKGFSGPAGGPSAGGIKDRFQVYDIVFDDEGNLVGLRPLLDEPNLLRVKTANRTVIQAPRKAAQPNDGDDGITPGPVKG